MQGALGLSADQKQAWAEARNEYLGTLCSLMHEQHQLIGPMQVCAISF